jgi:hypothetical protein
VFAATSGFRSAAARPPSRAGGAKTLAGPFVFSHSAAPEPIASHARFLALALERIALVPLSGTFGTTGATPSIPALLARSDRYKLSDGFRRTTIGAHAQSGFPGPPIDGRARLRVLAFPSLIVAPWMSPLPRAPRSTRLAAPVIPRRTSNRSERVQWLCQLAVGAHSHDSCIRSESLPRRPVLAARSLPSRCRKVGHNQVEHIENQRDESRPPISSQKTQLVSGWHPFGDEDVPGVRLEPKHIHLHFLPQALTQLRIHLRLWCPPTDATHLTRWEGITNRGRLSIAQRRV